jgi:hypothetical protein
MDVPSVFVDRSADANTSMAQGLERIVVGGVYDAIFT